MSVVQIVRADCSVQEVTWREIYHRAQAVREYLESRYPQGFGLRLGDTTSLETIVNVLAGLLAGGTVSVGRRDIDDDVPDGVTVVVFPDGFESHRSERIRLRQDVWGAVGVQGYGLAAGSIRQSTSGTTAAPSTITISGHALTANLAAIKEHLRLGPKDRVFSWLPLGHDMGLIASLLVAARLRAALRIIDPRAFLSRPSLWDRWISEFEPTYMAAPNSGWALLHARLAESREIPLRRGFQHLRVGITGGELISPDLCDQLESEKVGILPRGTLTPAYGLAEATVAVTAKQPSAERRAVRVPGNSSVRLSSCGTPFPGVDVRIDAPSKHGVGEVLVRSPSLAMEHVSDRWLRTGDQGFIDDGELVITGRLKDLLKAYGRSIHPEHVERSAESTGLVRLGRCAAFNSNHDGSGAIDLVVERHADAKTTDKELRAAVRQRVSIDCQISVEVHPMSSGFVVKTPSGKISRRATRERLRCQ